MDTLPGRRETGLSEEDALGTPPPNGPVAAAIMSACLFVFFLGLVTFIAAAGLGARDWLTFQQRVGPLSGKTTMAGVAWIASWGGLSIVWRKREIPLTPILVLAALLVVVGAVLMFPPIYERVEP